MCRRKNPRRWVAMCTLCGLILITPLAPQLNRSGANASSKEAKNCLNRDPLRWTLSPRPVAARSRAPAEPGPAPHAVSCRKLPWLVEAEGSRALTARAATFASARSKSGAVLVAAQAHKNLRQPAAFLTSQSQEQAERASVQQTEVRGEGTTALSVQPTFEAWSQGQCDCILSA